MQPIMNENIVSLFSLVLPKGTKLYKGSEQPVKMNYKSNKPTWFALSEKTANRYGPNIVTVTTAKPLKMLNINSELFNLHFKDCMNLRPLTDKEDILLCLGIPDMETQERIIKKNVPEKDRQKNQCLEYDSVKQQVKYYGNKSRYSGFKLDKRMAAYMDEFYGEFVDGYMQPIDRPTCWHGVFPREVCLFRLNGDELEESLNGGSAVVPRTVPVSALQFLHPRDMTPNEWTSLVRNSLKKEGYSAKYIKEYLRG
jgi:hypothetical protein